MSVTAADVASLIDEIWLTTLGLPTRSPGVTPPLAIDEPTLDGIIDITGAAHVTVVLQVPKPLCAKVAAAMFRLGTRTPRAEDMQDAVGELTNMLGGNLKALLGGECHLSLPAVVQGKAGTIRVPGAHEVTSVPFECEGLGGIVTVIAKAA
jgi:chemotaxis protein CheX